MKKVIYCELWPFCTLSSNFNSTAFVLRNDTSSANFGVSNSIMSVTSMQTQERRHQVYDECMNTTAKNKTCNFLVHASKQILF